MRHRRRKCLKEPSRRWSEVGGGREGTAEVEAEEEEEEEEEEAGVDGE